MLQQFSLNLGVSSSSQIAFTPQGLLVSTDVQSGINEAAQFANANPAIASWQFEDFTWGNESQTPSGQLGLVPTGSAGGGILVPANATGTTAGRWGVFAVGLGTSANSTAMGCVFSDYATLYAGQAQTSTFYASIFTPSALSDVTNEYKIEIGFRNSITTSLGTNSMCIMYDRTVSTNWMGYTSNNNTGTQVTTANGALAVTASAWWNFKIVVTASSVSFYAATPGNAYTLIGSSSTNLPSSSQKSYMCGIIYKASSFALQRVLNFDYMGLLNVFASAR